MIGDEKPTLEEMGARYQERIGARDESTRGKERSVEHQRGVDIDQLQRWGVAYQDACLITSPADLIRTPAIEMASSFIVGRGISGGDGSGEQRDPGGRKKTICVFAGPLGVGKTVAASYVLWHGHPKRLTGAWSVTEHCPRMMHVDALLAASRLPGESDEKMRRQLGKAKILVVDDVGLEKDPRRTMGSYFDWLVNMRYGGDGWLVLTTNLPAGDFKKRYGERIYDRLRHRAEWFEISHESLRKG